jgi:hypothetical protein
MAKKKRTTSLVDGHTLQLPKKRLTKQTKFGGYQDFDSPSYGRTLDQAFGLYQYGQAREEAEYGEQGQRYRLVRRRC